EPAPVDDPVEKLDLVSVAVSVDDRDLLGPGKEPVGLGYGGARGDALRLAPEIRLIDGGVGALVQEATGERLLLIGNDRRCPVLVGHAEPALRNVAEALLPGIADAAVAFFPQAFL